MPVIGDGVGGNTDGAVGLEECGVIMFAVGVSDEEGTGLAAPYD